MAEKTSITVVMTDARTGDTVQTSLSNVNPYLFSGTAQEVEAAYQRVDTVGRTISSMTQNTYVDTLVNRTQSVAEILNA